MWEKNIWQQLITLPEPKKNESKKEGLPDSAAFAAHWAQLGTPFVVCNSLHRFSKSPGAGGKHMSPQSIEGYRAGRDSAAKRHASWQIHLSTALLTASHTQMLLWQRKTWTNEHWSCSASVLQCISVLQHGRFEVLQCRAISKSGSCAARALKCKALPPDLGTALEDFDMTKHKHSAR